MLITNATINPVSHIVDSFPLVWFAMPRQVAKAASNNPAIIKMIQCIIFFYFFMSTMVIESWPAKIIPCQLVGGDLRNLFHDS